MAGGLSSSSRNTLPASCAISTAASRYGLIILCSCPPEPLLWPGQIGCPVPRGVARQHLHFNCTVGIGGPARIRVVSQPVLRPEFVVNTVKYNGQLLGGTREKHRATCSFGDGLERMLPGGVAAIFVLHRAHHDGIEQDSRPQGRLSRRLKI